MSKEEATTTAMADENNHPDNRLADEGFWRHWRAFAYCTIVCLGGLQLGKPLDLPGPYDP